MVLFYRPLIAFDIGGMLLYNTSYGIFLLSRLMRPGRLAHVCAAIDSILRRPQLDRCSEDSCVRPRSPTRLSPTLIPCFPSHTTSDSSSPRTAIACPPPRPPPGGTPCRCRAHGAATISSTSSAVAEPGPAFVSTCAPTTV